MPNLDPTSICTMSYSRTPPPPPPPPLPERSQTISPLPGLARDSLAHQNHTNLVARPTTAGLLQYPSIESMSLSPGRHSPGSQQVEYPRLASSPQFKKELLERQTKFSQLNSTSPIEDRIKSRQIAHEPLQTSPIANDDGPNPMPDKLLSSSMQQRDKRPFAYSPDVNDPNNRGKLDLTHIKSPVMRRRLIHNMQSQSENDEEAQDAEVDYIAPEENYTDVEIKVPVFNNHVFEQSPISSSYVTSFKPPNLSYNQNLSTTGMTYPSQSNASTIIHARVPPTMPDQRFGPETSVMRETTNSIVYYNEPPRFYNSRPANQIEPQTNSVAYNPRVDFHSSSARRDYLQEEVEKSLASLSLLVSNLETSGRL